MNIEYWIARYIDDPLRMEQKNIGVLASVEGRIVARFLGETEDGLDLRKVRGHVRHTGAYRQWIEYWRYVLANTEGREAITAICNSAKLNYSVSDASILTVPDAPEPYEVMEYLFNLLISSFPEPKDEELSLAQRCDEIIGEFRLRMNPYFSVSPTISCPLPNAEWEHVQPSFGYVNGNEIYYQKVPLVGGRPEYSAKEVHNAAWIFERLRTNRAERQTRALVKMSIATTFPDLLNALSSVSTSVIDVDNLVQVHQEFSPLSVR
jgi:hypothetical protein